VQVNTINENSATTTSYINSVMAETDLSIQRLTRRLNDVEEGLTEQNRETARRFINTEELETVRAEIFNELERLKMEDLQMRVETNVNRDFDKEYVARERRP